MNFKLPSLVSTIAQSAFLLSCILAAPSPGLAQDTEFFCGEGETTQEETVPATIARTSSNEEIIVILWAAEYFNQADNTSEFRCQLVSRRFQRYLDNDLLKYISVGIFNGLEVICVARSLSESCAETDIIVTLPPGVDRFEALDALLDLRRLAAGRPLYLTDNLISYRDGEVYINFDTFVNRALEDTQ